MAERDFRCGVREIRVVESSAAAQSAPSAQSEVDVVSGPEVVQFLLSCLMQHLSGDALPPLMTVSTVLVDEDGNDPAGEDGGRVLRGFELHVVPPIDRPLEAPELLDHYAARMAAGNGAVRAALELSEGFFGVLLTGRALGGTGELPNAPTDDTVTSDQPCTFLVFTRPDGESFLVWQADDAPGEMRARYCVPGEVSEGVVPAALHQFAAAAHQYVTAGQQAGG